MNQDQRDYVNFMNSLLSDGPKRELLVDFLHYLDNHSLAICWMSNPGTDGEHVYIPDSRTPEELVANFLASR